MEVWDDNWLKDILLEGEDIGVFDGELVSEATQTIGILRGEQDHRRKIDIMANSKHNYVCLELIFIEFKAEGSNDTTFMHQQSKNIRTNTCILNKINSNTKASNPILYMDWIDREKYLALIYQYDDIVVSQYVGTLYIPKKNWSNLKGSRQFKRFGFGEIKL